MSAVRRVGDVAIRQCRLCRCSFAYKVRPNGPPEYCLDCRAHRWDTRRGAPRKEYRQAPAPKCRPCPTCGAKWPAA